jgi:predicted GIY-YIG superfamily endonuclease
MKPLTTENMAHIPEIPGVYVLLCINGKRFTGAARNLRERLRDHCAGRVGRTHNQRPLRLIYTERCENFSTALDREQFLKSGKGREWLSQQTVSPPANPP